MVHGTIDFGFFIHPFNSKIFFEFQSTISTVDIYPLIFNIDYDDLGQWPSNPKEAKSEREQHVSSFLFELRNVAEPRDHHATFSNTEVLGIFWKTETLNLLPFQKEMSFSNPIDFQDWSVSFAGVYHSLVPFPWVSRSWWSWRHVFWSIPSTSERVLEVHIYNWIRPLMRIWKGYSPIHFEMKNIQAPFEMKTMWVKTINQLATNFPPSRRNTSKRDHGRPLAGQCGKEFAHLWAGKTKIVAWWSTQQTSSKRTAHRFSGEVSKKGTEFAYSNAAFWECGGFGRVKNPSVGRWLGLSQYLCAVSIHPVVFFRI